MESRRPVSNQPRTPAGWAEGDISSIKKSRVPVELTECVETKTITTTTTTQRSYPGLVVQEPRHLHDIKEYPLAARPVPPKLRSCTYSAGPNISESWTLGEQGYLVSRHRSSSLERRRWTLSV